MKSLRWVALLVTIGLIAGAAGAEAGSADDAIQRLTAELTAKPKPPDREAKALEADFALAFAHLTAGLAGDDTSPWQNTDKVLEQLCHYVAAPGYEAHRKAAAKALLAHVQDPKLTALGRERVIRHLERIGRAEAVPTLAKLLADKQLREPARRALMRNPDESAGTALTQALTAERGDFRVPLIDALGYRREPRFVKILIAQAQAGDADARLHAVEALARIAGHEAKTTVAAILNQGKGHARDQANDAYLALAEWLAETKDRGAALRMFLALLDAKETHLQCAALVGIGRAGSAKDVGTLVGAIASGPQQRVTALRALALLPDKQATAAIASTAGRASGELKALLVGVLGKRGDAAAVPFLLEAAKDDDAAVRSAAYGSLGDLKAPEGIATLIAGVKREQGGELAAAEQALGRIPGTEAVGAITAAVGEAQGPAKAALLRALTYRKDPDTLPVFVAAAKDADREVQVAAFRAMGVLNRPEAIPVLLAALATAKDEPYDAIGYALRRIRGKQATAAIVAAAEKASPAALAVILDIVSWRDDDAVRPLLVAAARNADPNVKAAALTGLARVKDPNAVQLIIEAATGPDGPVRTAAARAALAYTSEIIQADRAKAKALFSLGLDRKVLSGDEERRQAIRALGALGDPDVVGPLCEALRDRRLSGEAHGAIERIAAAAAKAGNKATAIDAYTQLVRRSPDTRRIAQIQGRLRKLGVTGDLAHRAGFITRWRIAGPFPNPRNELFGKKLGPEGEDVGVLLPVKAGGIEREWKALHVTDLAGTLDLRKAAGSQGSSAALLYAEITVAKPTLALLKLGYEEGCVAHVNGRKLHDRAGARFRLDERQVRVSLKAGVNRILIKATHLSRNWLLAARLSGPKHEAVEFGQGEK